MNNPRDKLGSFTFAKGKSAGVIDHVWFYLPHSDLILDFEILEFVHTSDYFSVSVKMLIPSAEVPSTASVPPQVSGFSRSLKWSQDNVLFYKQAIMLSNKISLDFRISLGDEIYVNLCSVIWEKAEELQMFQYI